MVKQRLSKVLAGAGVASRRACEELIFKGLVKVNDEIVKVPQTMVDLAQDEIWVRDKKVDSQKTKSIICSINLLAISVRRGGPAIKLDWF